MTSAPSRHAGRGSRLVPVLGVVLALALVVAGAVLVLPRDSDDAVSAERPVLENDELVVADLEPNGLPIEATLVSTVTARGGDALRVEDPASTVNVSYLDRRGAPETGDGVVLVEVGGPGTTSATTEATFDRPLPVALHAEYSLDGVVVPPRDVLGDEGLLTIRYTVTNTTAEQTTVRYEDAEGVTQSSEVPVFVPFAGTLDVLLPDGVDLVDAGSAARTTDARGRTLLRYSVLLAPPLGSFQSEFVLQARARDGATPQAVLEVVPSTSSTDPATGFGADLLAGGVEGNSELAAGLGELSEQTDELVNGASSLADGTDALASGATVLADQVGGLLLGGSRALDAGATELAGGAGALRSGLADAGTGADQLVQGLADLTAGLQELSDGLALLAGPDGLPTAVDSTALLVDAAGAIADGVGSPDDAPWPPPGLLPERPQLPPGKPDITALIAQIDAALAGVDSIDDLESLPDELTPEALAPLLEPYLVDLDLPDDLPPPTLLQSVRLLEQGTSLLAQLAVALVASVEAQKLDLIDAGASAARSSAGAVTLYAEVCGTDPVLSAEQCERLDGVAEDAEAAAAAALRAGKAAVAQAVLAAGIAAGTSGVQAALGFLEDAVITLSAALRSDDMTSPGLTEGLELLEDGLAESAAAARLLDAGAVAAATGGGELTIGAEVLAEGLADATSGADLLAEGSSALAQGTAANVAGVSELAAGTQGLADGAQQSAAGTALVADGVRALQQEGIDEIASAVAEAVEEPALAAAWVAATDARAADALPYGAPEGAVGRAAYRLTMAGTSSGGTPTWQWMVLAVAGAGAFGAVAYRRIAG